MPISPISLAVLLLPRSAQQVINATLAYIANPPDPSLISVRTANWRTGGPYRTLLYRQGLETELLYQIGAAFAGSAFLRTAAGKWLDWLGEDYFDEPRQTALFATADLTITVPVGAGPLGPLEVRAQTTDGKVFISTSLVTIPAGASTVTFGAKASTAGAAYNVGANTITQLITPNALGLSVTNAAIATGGYDEEPDARYAQRLRAKWGALSTGSTQAAYVFWALSSNQEIQKVRVYSNLVLPSTFTPEYTTVVLAGNGTTVSGAAVVAAQAFIEPLIPLNSHVIVASCSVFSLAVTGTARIFNPYLSTAPAKISASLQALGQRVPIGSYDAGPVPLAEFIDAAMYDSREMYDVTISAPTGPVSLAKDQILVATNALTPSGV